VDVSGNLTVVIVVVRIVVAHGAKQRHSHRLLMPGDPALRIGCVKGAKRDVEDGFYSAYGEVRHRGMR
jgi:hypothetical protein